MIHIIRLIGAIIFLITAIPLMAVSALFTIAAWDIKYWDDVKEMVQDSMIDIIDP